MNRSTRQFFAALGGVAVVLLVGPDADANVDVLVSDISVSNGYVYGNSVILPVGETLTIGTRVVDPSATLVRGLGLSYYGYDDAVLGRPSTLSRVSSPISAFRA